MTSLHNNKFFSPSDILLQRGSINVLSLATFNNVADNNVIGFAAPSKWLWTAVATFEDLEHNMDANFTIDTTNNTEVSYTCAVAGRYQIDSFINAFSGPVATFQNMEVAVDIPKNSSLRLIGSVTLLATPDPSFLFQYGTIIDDFNVGDTYKPMLASSLSSLWSLRGVGFNYTKLS